MSSLSKNRAFLGLAVFFAVILSFSVRAETIVASHYGFLFNTAPIAVAIERGEFKKRGVDITDVISSAGGGTTMRNQIASGSGYGVVGTAAVLAAYREGHDIKIVSANVMSIADLFLGSDARQGDQFHGRSERKEDLVYEAALDQSNPGEDGRGGCRHDGG